MITRATATLQAAIGLFAALAVVCAVDLARTLAGKPVGVWEFAIFVAVAASVTGAQWHQLVKAAYARERILQEGERLRNQHSAVALQERTAALAPVPVVAAEPEYDDAKASQVETFFRAGTAAGGYSIRRLKDVVGSTTWGRLTKFYSSEPGWHVLFDYDGTGGYALAEKWTIDMVLTEIAAGHFPLPPFQVRDIRPFVRDTRRNATRQQQGSGAGGQIIEGEAVRT